MLLFRRVSMFSRIIIVIILVFLLGFLLFHKTLTPLFFNIAEVEAKKIATRAIHEAVNEGVEYIQYRDLVSFIYDENGNNILVMQPNTGYINNFISEISLSIQQKLEESSKKSVTIPLARILGIEILAGFGPELEAIIIPLGFTEPPLVLDSFTSAGINQTRHRIYLKVMARLKLIVPLSSRYVDVTADVPVTEVVILGRVPEVYIGIDGEQLEGIMNKQIK